MPRNDAHHPVLIVTPTGHDAPSIADVLHRSGIHCRIDESLAACADDIASTAAAAVLVTEEAIEREQLPVFFAALEAQPEWSEVPIIVLARGGEARRATLFDLIAAAPGVVTLLERPLHSNTLLEAVRVALRSRRRQYLVRDLLAQQHRNLLERQQQAEVLEHALEERTKQVTQAQRTLAVSERMAAVGTLAAGLAHDLSNVLMPLSLQLGGVVSDPALSDKHRDDMNVIVALVDHLRQMAKNLSLFSRDPDHEGSEGTTMLFEWKERVQSLIESSVRTSTNLPSIHVEWEFASDLGSVRIAPHRLTQMVLNLVQNARDAIHAKRHSIPSSPPSGTIRVFARFNPDRSRVILGVTDNGVGMSEVVKQRCIEPFFTTKDRPAALGVVPSASHGSGMGLALAHSITQKAGGELHIFSQVGHGTTIELHLPGADTADSTEHVMREAKPTSWHAPKAITGGPGYLEWARRAEED